MVETIGQWMTELLNLGLDMRRAGTLYGWDPPITVERAKKRATCVSYVSAAMQKSGLLPSGYYVHMEKGRLLGKGAEYIKKHPELFEIIWVRATPQKLGNALKMGDICLYNVPHIMVYDMRNANGSPIWYSLERGKGGYGKPAELKLAGVYSYYTKRRIECIIRPKLTPPNGTETKPKPVPTQYRLKQTMNLRAAPNAKKGTKILTTIPRGAVLTVLSSSGTWKKVDYCGVIGWTNCSSRYAAKL